MKNAELVLVHAENRSMPVFKKLGATHHPIGLLCLATYMREHGHSVRIFDLDVSPADGLLRFLKETPPRLVGITVMTAELPAVKRICAFCAQLGIKTVTGGPHPSALPEDTLRYTGCDFAIVGEGEIALRELFSALTAGHPAFDSIAGLAWRDGENIRVNGRAIPPETDKLPVPDRTLLDLPLYRGHSTLGVPDNGTLVFTSRGCPFVCTFCASRNVFGRGARLLPMESIFREIDACAALGLTHITIGDDTFTLNKQRVIAFCRYLQERYPRMTWNCNSRVDTIDEEMLGWMKKTNCVKIAFGVESGSPRILQSICKRITIEQVKKAFALTRKYKIHTQAFFMIGHPGETAEDIAMTEKLIYDIRPDYLFLSVFVPLPGTKDFAALEAAGKLKGVSWDDFIFFGEQAGWGNEHFTGEELVKLRRKISLRFYFTPRYIFDRIAELRSWEQLKYMAEGAVAVVKAFLLGKK